MTNSKVANNSNIIRLCQLQEKPLPFATGDPLWTDPYIAQQMLSMHLDTRHDAASRRPQTIDRSTEWIIKYSGAQKGEHILDLGCGPGLYAERFARAGFQVTGVDFSQNSINYAIASARKNNLSIEYRCQDYLQFKDENQYSVILLIYGDYCPLQPDHRMQLLANIQRALKPDGYFIFDVTTPLLRQKIGLKTNWYAEEQGFWKPVPHLVLERGFSYPGDLYLDQYIVIDENGKISVYNNWFQDFTADRIKAELNACGFEIESLWSDLTGSHFSPSSDWIGVVARSSIR